MKILTLSIIFVVIIGIVSFVVTIMLEDHPLEIISAKPILISKQQAINIATSGIQCTKDPYRLNSTTIIGQLFHIKNNTVFFVDDKNIQDMNLASNYLSTIIKSKDYVWEIGWNCYDATSVSELHKIGRASCRERV